MEPGIKTAHTPGRGHMNPEGYRQRMEFLANFDIDFEPVTRTGITQDQVKHNIESFIGTVEIPVGIVGPLTLNTENEQQEVFGAIATTEGALVASMSRGAKAVNESGGFSAHVLYQKMVRTPMFTFASLSEAVIFESWIREQFAKIKKVTRDHSNYADLLEIKPVVIGKIVHLKFVYTTGDASGQNMTTTCTWHACLWIEQHFNRNHSFPITRFVIDGNGASDKKVSYYSLQSGRGVHVVAESFLTNDSIARHLRTTATDIFQAYVHSMAISRMDGMVGYNINIANTIAGFFAATAQDLACIHESSTGILQIEQTETGLYVSLSLPNLVIGTVGGGTHLPAQRALLQLMGCNGKGGVQRLAKIIAGFALSLEISTLAAIVSGQFARAHQEMGRNKPVHWLLRSEITPAYIRDHITLLATEEIQNISLDESLNIDNGVLTELTGKVSRKVIGFIPFTVHTADGPLHMVIKSKPLDEEVVRGLHFMATAVNSGLADLLLQYGQHFEFINSHVREVEVYEYLHRNHFTNMPAFYGSHSDNAREIHLFFMEYLDPSGFKLFNSENRPGEWTTQDIGKAIESITAVHVFYLEHPHDRPQHVSEFDPLPALPFYQAIIEVNRNEYAEWDMDEFFCDIANEMSEAPVKKTPLTLVHNDYNPRNIGVWKDGSICVYDWELARLNIPQRDIVELLSFVMEETFTAEELMKHIHFHHQLFETKTGIKLSSADWLADCIVAAYEYLYTRVSFYLAGGLLMEYPFARRIFSNTIQMIRFLKAQ